MINRVVLGYLKKVGGVSWYKPSFEEESDEIERVARDLSLESRDVLSALEGGSLISLSEDTWAHLDNTDSFATKDLSEVLRLAEEYDRPSVQSIIEKFKHGGSLPAAIVLGLPDGSDTLVGGNTRLMVARAFGQLPKVWYARI